MWYVKQLSRHRINILAIVWLSAKDCSGLILPNSSYTEEKTKLLSKELILQIGLIHKEGIQSPTDIFNLVAGPNDAIPVAFLFGLIVLVFIWLRVICLLGDMDFIPSVVFGDT